MAAVCRDFETAPLGERERALFRLLSRVNDEPSAVTPEDVGAARAAGWSDEALYDAITVCAAFNFFNRWIDGTGVPDVPEGFYERHLEAHGDVGYAV